MAGENDDVLGREVAIKAHMDATGLSVSAKSRLLAAIDRLAGSLFDWPAAAMEGLAAKRRLKDRIERELLEAEGHIAARRPEFGETAQGALLLEADKEAVRRQLNKSAVAAETVEALKLAPPAQSADGPGPHSGPDDVPDLDEDWLNAFARYAEDASSEDLQRLWGRVLAGEVGQPGKFSRRTLRFIAELDKPSAADCEAVAPFLVGDFIFRSGRWDSGDGLSLMLRLEEVGLVAGAGGTLHRKLTVDANGLVAQLGAKRALLFRGTPGTVKELPALKVTRLGHEVFSLLKPADEDGLLKEIAAAVDKQGLTAIELGPFRLVETGGVQVYDATLVWPAGASG
ncbi:MAG TPA: DUF2806 domain-containing protein [Allosphingosinicella sp.]